MRLRHLVGPAAVALALAACGTGGGPGPLNTGGGDDPHPSVSGSRPTELPPQLVDCFSTAKPEDPNATPNALQLSTADLTQATWSTPAGFKKTSGYYEDNPFESSEYDIWYADTIQAPQSLNVLNVVRYQPISWDQNPDSCDRVPWAAVEDRLAGYREKIRAVELSRPEVIEIDGVPAIKQTIRLDRYDYEGYFIFSETQLMHLYCQWTNPGQEAEIRRGCDALVASVKIPK